MHVKHVMHSSSDDIEILIYTKGDKFLEVIFESLLYRYQIGLNTSVTGSGFISYHVNLLY